MNVHHRSRGGFTLVELLVVIVIIGMLMGLLTPAIIAARARARTTQCTNNQKNLAAAITQYELNKQQFPGYVNRVPGLNKPGSWLVMILQQVDRADLWDEWRNPSGASGTPDVGRVALFVCPSMATNVESPLSYVANCGQQDSGIAEHVVDGLKVLPDWPANGVFHNRFNATPTANISMSDLKDGTQHTLLISENNQAGSWSEIPAAPAVNLQEPNWGMVWWQHPGGDEKKVLDINEDRDAEYVAGDYNHARPSSYHGGGAVAAFCDGHVQFLNEAMDYEVYTLLMTPDGSKARSTKTGKPMPPPRKLDESDLQ